MRYEVRWNNGYWKLFDKHYYTDAAIFGLKKEAEQEAAKANAQNAVKR